MWQPLMCDDDLLMSFQSRFYPACLPVPEDQVARAVTTTDPLSVGRESDLTCVSRNSMSCKTLLTVLSEVIRAIDEDLVVERLGGEVFLWMR